MFIEITTSSKRINHRLSAYICKDSRILGFDLSMYSKVFVALVRMKLDDFSFLFHLRQSIDLLRFQSDAWPLSFLDFFSFGGEGLMPTGKGPIILCTDRQATR